MIMEHCYVLNFYTTLVLLKHSYILVFNPRPKKKGAINFTSMCVSACDIVTLKRFRYDFFLFDGQLPCVGKFLSISLFHQNIKIKVVAMKSTYRCPLVNKAVQQCGF